MQTKRKFVWNGIFLAVIFALTLYCVFRGEDMGAILEAIGEADIRWLIPGVGLVVFYIWGEAIALWCMLSSFRNNVKMGICFLFATVDFFFSGITPSATGGQPMQIYYMKKEKIPIPVATVILMLVTITYKLVLVVIGLGILCFGRDFIHHYLEDVLPVFYLGILLNVFCVSFMSALVFHPALAEKILTKGMSLLERLRFLKHREERRKKLQEAMGTYRETAAYLKNHGRVMAGVILITFAQRMALFAVTWTVYKAFGGTGMSMWEVMLLQAVISICVDMLPLPGGMGISEALFLNIFAPVFHSMLLPAMVLSRGLGYYGQLLISAFFTAVTHIYYAASEGNQARTK